MFGKEICWGLWKESYTYIPLNTSTKDASENITVFTVTFVLYSQFLPCCILCDTIGHTNICDFF